MATSKLIAKAAKYGARSRDDYVASAATHMYVGRRSSDSGTYYSRLTMPALSSGSQIGGNRVSIDGAKLWLYLNDSEGGATTITVVGSASSSYSATGPSIPATGISTFVPRATSSASTAPAETRPTPRWTGNSSPTR